MKNREYIAMAVAIILLLWGPIDHSWPFWLAIRIGYLILIPLFTWFLLGLIWKAWQPNEKGEWEEPPDHEKKTIHELGIIVERITEILGEEIIDFYNSINYYNKKD